MSSISALNVPGLAVVPSAKPAGDDAAQARGAAPEDAAVSSAVPTYPSPIFAIDPVSDRVIIEYRDEASGQITQQLPPKDVVRLYEQSNAAAGAAGAGATNA